MSTLADIIDRRIEGETEADRYARAGREFADSVDCGTTLAEDYSAIIRFYEQKQRAPAVTGWLYATTTDDIHGVKWQEWEYCGQSSACINGEMVTTYTMRRPRREQT